MNKYGQSSCVYLNTYSYNQHHEFFNTSLIKALMTIYDDVDIYSTNTSWKYLSRNIEDGHYNKHELFGITKNTPIYYLLRYYISAFQNIRIYLKEKKSKDIFFAFENVISLWIINKLNKIFKKNIYVFCHGELELLHNNTRGITTNILRHYTKRAFLNVKFNNIKLIVLGDIIKNNLHKVSNIDPDNILSVDLPFLKRETSVKKSIHSDSIKLGIIGSITPARGSFLYKKILDENVNMNIEFYIVGNIKKKDNIFNESKVTIYGKDQFLPREDFDKYVNDLDFILMLYSNDYYHLTASAAFFDAIIYKKPIIGLKNEYFNYLFEKYGRVGYLFDNVEQIQNFINNFDNQTTEVFDYSSYYENLQLDGFIRSLKSVLGK